MKVERAIRGRIFSPRNTRKTRKAELAHGIRGKEGVGIGGCPRNTRNARKSEGAPERGGGTPPTMGARRGGRRWAERGRRKTDRWSVLQVRLREREGEGGVKLGLSEKINFEVTLLKAVEASRSRAIDSLIKELAALADESPAVVASSDAAGQKKKD